MYVYTCLTCNKVFDSLRGKSNPPKYCCHLCYSASLRSQNSLENLSNARKKVIPQKRADYVCLVCSKTFYCKNKKRNPQYCTRKCFQQRIKTDETIAKMSEAKKGKNPWNIGVKMWEGKEHPRGTLGKPSKLKGTKRSQETIQKCKDSHYGKKYPERSGENHHYWKGGVTPENMRIRKSSDYSNWRRKVFERDDFTCVLCLKKGGYLNADHIMPFSTHPELRLNLENGRTLCTECHIKTDTFGGKMHKKTKKKHECPACGHEFT